MSPVLFDGYTSKCAKISTRKLTRQKYVLSINIHFFLLAQFDVVQQNDKDYYVIAMIRDDVITIQGIFSNKTYAVIRHMPQTDMIHLSGKFAAILLIIYLSAMSSIKMIKLNISIAIDSRECVLVKSHD